jgi:DNA-binding IclR family transcriptional regulator
MLTERRFPYELSNLLIPYLIELYERTADAVSLGVLDGYDMVVLINIRGPQHRWLPVPEERTPAHSSAIGKLLLGYQANRAALAYAGTLAPCTPYTMTSPAQLARQLEKVHRSGVAFANEEHVVGLFDIAMPIIVGDCAIAGIARSRPSTVPADSEADLAQRQIALAASAAIGRYAHHATQVDGPDFRPRAKK